MKGTRLLTRKNVLDFLCKITTNTELEIIFS